MLFISMKVVQNLSEGDQEKNCHPNKPVITAEEREEREWRHFFFSEFFLFILFVVEITRSIIILFALAATPPLSHSI